jgi:hypothetical protein
MGQQLENIYQLKHYPDIQEWFLGDAMRYVIAEIPAMILQINDDLKQSSTLTAWVDENDQCPWPKISCRTHEPWDTNIAIPLGKQDFRVVNALALKITSTKIRGHHLHTVDFRPGKREFETANFPIYQASFRFAPQQNSF